ncbi:Sec14p-like phosphatidylinositol transfer family protein [Rhynchospora pubera]|uniref:Sec14p-like phosphatidylinositol transfer family protein n=1 Tax=Rhynchospora pubera TaxID=906938 RepID=A0AAV8HVY4_9POAL|nr:Sec14p-like phosphatidylinositol transfer family protein [Rhynchospora pubera]
MDRHTSNKSKSSLYISIKASNEEKKPKIMAPLLPLGQLKLGQGQAQAQGAICFLAKLAALETARRISAAKCPVFWNALQALQLFSYPPFNWARRWTPLRFLITAIQNISKPLLLISVTTALVDHSKHVDKPNETIDDADETSATSSHLDAGGSDKTAEDLTVENWSVQLFKELEKQGITLSERIDMGELRRFHSAANGDLSVLLSSLKKTIRWRETYHLLSLEELERWSHLVFWHGCDVMFRPCLVIRLGFACSSLAPKDRPRFAQAVVSQIEYGIMHLVKEDEPMISVLMDCKGVSPFRFPMQMLRAVTTLVQENYPNRLGRLLIVRLPPVVRVITQTFIQVLKPATRQKMRLEGEAYQKVLREFVETIPGFLGGNCNCVQCRKIIGKVETKIEEMCSGSKMQFDGKEVEFEVDETAGIDVRETESHVGSECNHLLRSVIVGFVMLWVVIAFLAGINEDDSVSQIM